MSGRRYRVLAADDEYWSRENIRNLIKWDDYSMDFLEPACDGEEVLERIPKDRPDIILTDINMPFVSGLELLDQIHDKYPDLITIAISGYDDFQKVKGVFVAGGIDYLLKPVSREQLAATLTKALQLLEERLSRKQQDFKVSSLLEDNEYSSLLNGKLYHPSAQAHVPSTVTFSEISMVLVKFHDMELLTQKYGHDILQMSYSIKTRIRGLMNLDQSIVFNYSDKVSEFIIFGNGTGAQLQALSASILKEFDPLQEGPITVVVHDRASSLDEIGTIYREMIADLVMRPFSRQSLVLGCGRAQADQLVVPHADRLLGELPGYLRRGDRTGAEELIFAHAGLGSESSRWSVLSINQFTTRVTNICSELDPEAVSDEVADELNYGIRTLQIQVVQDSLRVAIDAICGSRTAQETGSIIEQVAHVHDYIEKNYPEHITLSEMAEKYHVDPSYLSRTFSATYGETITAFITRQRVEHAISMMQDGSRKLEAISFAVGYDDYNYFSRVFRKQTGHSPSEYRKSEIGS